MSVNKLAHMGISQIIDTPSCIMQNAYDNGTNALNHDNIAIEQAMYADSVRYKNIVAGPYGAKTNSVDGERPPSLVRHVKTLTLSGAHGQNDDTRAR